MGILQLPKRSNPDFGNPRKKPVGNVEIDLSNDFAKRLLFSVLPSQPSGVVRDLISSEQSTNTNVSTLVRDGDVATVYNDSNSKAVFTDSKVLISDTTPWTICWRGRLDLFGTQEHDVASLKSTAVNSFLLLHLSNGSYTDIAWGMSSATFAQGRADFNNALLEQDTVYFLAFDGVNAASLSSYSFWVNKAEQSIVSGGGFGSVSNVTTIGNVSTSSSNAYGGYQKYFHVFDFDFKQGDVKRFFDDQYQVLKPKTPPTYFTSSVAGGLDIQPTGIPSAEAFGTSVITTGAVDISPTGIASAEAFGSHTVTLTQTLSPNGIASEEAFGTAALTTGAVIVTPNAIASAEAFGTADVSQAIFITPTGIASAEVFGTAVVTTGAVSVSPTGIASEEAFGSHTVAVAGDKEIKIDFQDELVLASNLQSTTLYFNGSNYFTID